jgi:hypothetical protein
VILLSVGLTAVAHTTIKYLQSENRKYKRLHEDVLDEAHEWEKHALQYAGEIRELAIELEDREIREESPPSHGVQPINTEQIIANSDDPVWSVVEECRDLMPLWELKNPGIAAAQSHHRYAQFATFVANLCDEHRNRDGVARAIEILPTPGHV